MRVSTNDVHEGRSDADARGCWEISHGVHRGEVIARGAALRTYTVHGSGVVDGFVGDEVPPAFNGAILAPWPNRVRDGRWTWDGVELELPVNERSTQTALHGLLLWNEWRAVATTPSSVRLVSSLLPQPGYPFALVVEVEWSVGEDGLRCDLAVRNDGDRPAPFGIGTHPFFGFEGHGVDDLTLSVPARTWVPTDDRLLPLAARPTAGSALDFTERRSLAGVSLDTAFSDVIRTEDGRTVVTLAAPDKHLDIWADRSFGWWQVYTSDMFDRADERYRRSVAIEAMTCGPDAFNSGDSVIVLPPGDAWQGSWGVQPRIPVP